jgi:hypothetical protein
MPAFGIGWGLQLLEVGARSGRRQPSPILMFAFPNVSQEPIHFQNPKASQITSYKTVTTPNQFELDYKQTTLIIVYNYSPIRESIYLVGGLT